jgi:hypothetical protein
MGFPTDKFCTNLFLTDNQKNFVHERCSWKDVQLFLGSNVEPIEEVKESDIIRFSDSDIMAHIMNKAGIFPSVSQARKNGWNKPIPQGYTEFVVGKNKTFIFILNIKD